MPNTHKYTAFFDFKGICVCSAPANKQNKHRARPRGDEPDDCFVCLVWGFRPGRLLCDQRPVADLRPRIGIRRQEVEHRGRSPLAVAFELARAVDVARITQLRQVHPDGGALDIESAFDERGVNLRHGRTVHAGVVREAGEDIEHLCDLMLAHGVARPAALRRRLKALCLVDDLLAVCRITQIRNRHAKIRKGEGAEVGACHVVPPRLGWWGVATPIHSLYERDGDLIHAEVNFFGRPVAPPVIYRFVYPTIQRPILFRESAEKFFNDYGHLRGAPRILNDFKHLQHTPGAEQDRHPCPVNKTKQAHAQNKTKTKRTQPNKQTRRRNKHWNRLK